MTDLDRTKPWETTLARALVHVALHPSLGVTLDWDRDIRMRRILVHFILRTFDATRPIHIPSPVTLSPTPMLDQVRGSAPKQQVAFTREIDYDDEAGIVEDRNEFAQWLKKQLLSMFEHEIEEALRIDGELMFEPHPELAVRRA